ncbi:MAG: family 78 glycoside hydrolase catalytic domain, partial [Tepidisphaeraceae bacterium]
MLLNSSTYAALAAERLRCEYRDNPAGIDVVKPRLSWRLRSDQPDARGQRQSAYHILVASTLEALTGNTGDLWDTGKVQSDETIQIPYGGKPLRSGQEAWWKVRVADGDGNESPWSEPALWSAGLLEPGDWKGKWIGYDAPDAQAALGDAPPVFVDLKGAKWVWFDEGDPITSAPAGEWFFRGAATVPSDRAVQRAVFAITADNAFKLFVNGKEAGSGGNFNVPVMIDVSPHLKAGANVFAISAKNADVGPAGLIGRLRVEFASGDPLVTEIDRSWKSAKAGADGWQSAQFDDSAWTPAKELSTAGEKPWGMPEVKQLILPPPPHLRKTFETSKPIKRATAYATALGIYELSINGVRIGDDELRPGWTEYKKRVYYQAYDVTPQIRSGRNAIGAILGDGWYAGYFGFNGNRNIYVGEPRFGAQVNIEYADGSSEIIATDESWKAAYGPIREADLLMGCTYDASREMPDWDTPEFNDAKWQPVVVSDAPKIAVRAQPTDSVKRIEELPARTITEPKPGVYVFDLEQNMVGWIRAKFSARKGDAVRFRFAEMLNPDGTLYTTALRGARATDTYIAAKDGEIAREIVWEPRLTFHGFRYVEITGVASKPDLRAVTGIVAHNVMPRTGWYECSDPLVNQLVKNIAWGQKGNYLEVPTDCPQRDERLGWTGDAQFFVRTGAYNFDVASFFTKWLVDLDQDSQHADGKFADVAPDVLGGGGNTAWGDAGIICPYTIWQMYGDTRIIAQHYDAMVRCMDYFTKNSKDHVRGVGAYGDWLNLDNKTKPQVIGTAYYHYDARLMSEMAAAIGKTEDAQRYAKLAGEIKAAFQKSFVQPDGGLLESGQTGYALAFTMDLIPADLREKSAAKFALEIEKKDWHLATGFIGTPRLLPGLSDAGRDDVAYRLLLTKTFPSWLFPVTLGATTMWERWDGWHPERGFQDPGMNSFNHYAFGSVGQWLYMTSAGIDADGPGFKRIVIRPTVTDKLTHASSKYDSIRGMIESGWEKKDGKLTITCVIPPNTTATVHVPAAEPARVTEGGNPASQARGVKFVKAENGAAVYEVGSGRYTFA